MFDLYTDENSLNKGLIKPNEVQVEGVAELNKIQVEPNEIQVEGVAELNEIQVEPNEIQVEPNEIQVEPNEIQVEPNEIQVEPNEIQVEPNEVELYYTNDNITTFNFKEIINIHNLDIIIANFDEIFSNLPKYRQDNLKQDIKLYKSLLPTLKNMKKKQDLINSSYPFCSFLNKYDYARDRPKNDDFKCFGRLFSIGASLQTLPHEFRNSIIDNSINEVDVKNCHPVIYAQYCKKNEIDCSHIDNYVENRDEIIEKISKDTGLSNEEIKENIITVMNGGIRKIDKSLEFQKIAEEFSNNNIKICNLPSNKKLYSSIKRRKVYNIEGTVINYIISNIEKNILISNINFLKINDIEPSVLQHDGFYTESKYNLLFTDEFLNEMANYTFEHTSYQVEFKLKPLKDIIDLSKYTASTLKEKEVEVNTIEVFGYLWKNDIDSGVLTDEGLEIYCNKMNQICKDIFNSNGSDVDIAKSLQLIAKNELKYFNSDKNKNWYFCNDYNVWSIDTSKTKISYYIDEIFTKMLKKLINIYKDDAKTILKTLIHIKAHSKKSSIMKECECIFTDNDFINNLDTNPELLAFKNVVVDFKMKIIRDIQPNDGISITIGRNYDANEFNEDDTNKVLQFIKSIFEGDDMFNYIMNILSRMINGKDPSAEFFIFTGKGSNGKSAFMDQIGKMLGKYHSKLKAQTITQSARSGMEFSEFAKCKAVRNVSIEEPPVQQPIDSSNIKIWGDKRGYIPIGVRGFNQDNTTILPMFMIFLSCNHKPKLLSVDGGVKRRIRVIGFNNTFVEPDIFEKSKHIKNIKLKNDKLLDEIKEDKYLNAFLNYLIYFNFENCNKPDYYHHKLPKEVYDDSKEYFDESNELTDFINDYYIITYDDDDKIQASVILDFYKSKMPPYDKLCKNSKIFYENLASIQGISKFKTTKCNYYRGLKFKPEGKNEFIEDE